MKWQEFTRQRCLCGGSLLIKYELMVFRIKCVECEYAETVPWFKKWRRME